MAERLFRAYFTDALNVADHGTLVTPTEGTGMRTHDGGATEPHAELDRVRGLGFTAGSVPAFRFDTGPVLSGEQREETFFAAFSG